MHVLKKVGTTLLAGGVVGAFATTALGTSELLTVGDYGDYSQPNPDGNADRIIWDSVEGTVTFTFVDGTGLNVLDTSGGLVGIVVSGTNGTNSGYGLNATTCVAGLRACMHAHANRAACILRDDVRRRQPCMRAQASRAHARTSRR